jgi:hypothetical protein
MTTKTVAPAPIVMTKDGVETIVGALEANGEPMLPRIEAVARDICQSIGADEPVMSGIFPLTFNATLECMLIRFNVRVTLRWAHAQSVAKWRRNEALARAGKIEDVNLSSRECALCVYDDLNRDTETDDICAACPVMAKTGQDDCLGTPFYESWDILYVLREQEDTPTAAQCQELGDSCGREADFLEGLLP